METETKYRILDLRSTTRKDTCSKFCNCSAPNVWYEM